MSTEPNNVVVTKICFKCRGKGAHKHFNPNFGMARCWPCDGKGYKTVLVYVQGGVK